jgi:hypothetical protein
MADLRSAAFIVAVAGFLALTTGHSGLLRAYTVTKDDQYRTQPAAPAPAGEVRAALASARR